METLVERAQRGDELAFARLAREYRPALRHWIGDYFGPGLVAEDLMQEAMLGLWKAVRDFRDERPASFRSFAQICVTRQVITAVKTATRLKHGPLNDSVSTDTPAGDDGRLTVGELLPARRGDPVATLLASERARALFAAIKWNLSELEARVVWALDAEGLSYERVAAEMGVPAKAVDNAAQRARRKLGEALSVGERCSACGEIVDYGNLCPPCQGEFDFAKQFIAA